MSGHLSLEELSGHLDGEARNGEAVRRHLESCGACSEKQRELSAAMRYLRSVPEPEVSPNFAANVVRAIEAREARRAPLLVRMTMPVMAAAMILLAAATTFGIYSGNSAHAPTATVASVASLDDGQALMLELERLVAENPQAGSLLTADIVVEPEPRVAPADELLLALYDPAWIDGVAQIWVEEVDFDTAVTRLDADETESLKALLRQYAEEAGAL